MNPAATPPARGDPGPLCRRAAVCQAAPIAALDLHPVPAPARAAIPARRLTLLLAIAQVMLAVLLAGLGELALLYSGADAPDPPFAAALFVIGAWTYAAAGAVAWVRRPSSLMGLLLTAGAFLWLAAGLNNTDVPALVAAGQIVQTLPIALLIHLLLAFRRAGCAARRRG